MSGRKTAASFSPEVRERAVRLVLEHQGEHGSQWAAMTSSRVHFQLGPPRCVMPSRRSYLETLLMQVTCISAIADLPYISECHPKSSVGLKRRAVGDVQHTALLRHPKHAVGSFILHQSGMVE